MTAQYEGVTKIIAIFTEMIQRRVFLVFLRSKSQYYTCQLFLSQMREIFTLWWPDFQKHPGDFWRFPTNFRRLPNFAEMSADCSRRLLSTSEALLWYDFVRTQKRTQSHHVLRTICPDLWVRREKLSLMREIDLFSPQEWDSCIIRERWQVSNILSV